MKIYIQSNKITAITYCAYFIFLVLFLSLNFDRLYPYPNISNEVSFTRITTSSTLLLLSLLAFLFLQPNSSTASIMHMFMVLSIVPAFALYATANVALWACFTYLYFLYAIVFFNKVINPRRGKNYISEKLKSNILVFFALFFILFFFYIHRFSIDLNVFTLKAEDIYETRLEVAEQRGQISRYFYSWATKIFLPLAVVYGFITKRKLLIIFGLLGMSYLFATSAHKSVLLSTLLLVFLSGRQSFAIKNTYFVAGFLAFIVFCYGVFIFFENDLLQSLFIRRMIILPAILNQYYYEIYSNQYAFYSHSFLSGISQSPYTETPPYVVGLQYFNSDTISANNGFVSDGFANIGFFGAYLQATVLSILLVLLSKFKISSRYYGFIFIFVYQFNTSATSTTLLSHGFILLLILAYFGFTDSESRLEKSKRFLH